MALIAESAGSWMVPKMRHYIHELTWMGHARAEGRSTPCSSWRENSFNERKGRVVSAGWRGGKTPMRELQSRRSGANLQERDTFLYL